MLLSTYVIVGFLLLFLVSSSQTLRELGKEQLDKLQISKEDISYPTKMPFASGTYSEVLYGLSCVYLFVPSMLPCCFRIFFTRHQPQVGILQGSWCIRSCTTVRALVFSDEPCSDTISRVTRPAVFTTSERTRSFFFACLS